MEKYKKTIHSSVNIKPEKEDEDYPKKEEPEIYAFIEEGIPMDIPKPVVARTIMLDNYELELPYVPKEPWDVLFKEPEPVDWLHYLEERRVE